MKSKTLFISIVIGVLGLITFILYIIKRVEYGMADNVTHYSKGIEESKTNGLFLGYYKPLQDSLVLDSFTMKTENIWYEKNWTTEHNFLFQEKTRIDSGIHFIVSYAPLLSSELKIDICLKENFPGCSGC